MCVCVCGHNARQAYRTPLSGKQILSDMVAARIFSNIEQIFELLGVRLESENVGGVRKEVGWHFTDVDEHWRLELSNRTLSCWHARSVNPDASVRTTRADLLAVILGDVTMIDAVTDGRMVIDGDPQALVTIFTNLEVFKTGFAIVEP